MITVAGVSKTDINREVIMISIAGKKAGTMSMYVATPSPHFVHVSRHCSKPSVNAGDLVQSSLLYTNQSATLSD
jgi:hypothetical protein